MTYRPAARPLPELSAAALLAALPVAAPAVVVQGPADGVVVNAGVLNAFARWGNNAAAVAVAPDWVLTSRHPDRLDAPPDRDVVFQDGAAFRTRMSDPANALNLSPDLRLVRIFDADGNPAARADTLSVLTPDTALAPGDELTIGGFGPGRGTPEADGFAHQTGGAAANGNPLRFGLNRFDGGDTVDDPDSPFDGLAVLLADFTEANTPGATAAEAGLGPGDSGGAWLIDVGGGLQIAGLSFAVAEPPEDDPTTPLDESDLPASFFGQGQFAADARPFAGVINTIPEPGTAALGGLAALGLLARRRR